MKFLLEYLGLTPSNNDIKLKTLIDNSYATLRVVGRGTVMISPKEIKESTEFVAARKLAKIIVENSQGIK